MGIISDIPAYLASVISNFWWLVPGIILVFGQIIGLFWPNYDAWIKKRFSAYNRRKVAHYILGMGFIVATFLAYHEVNSELKDYKEKSSPSKIVELEEDIRRLQPRHLTEFQKSELTVAARQVCPIDPIINVATNLMDTESVNYALEFVDIFKEAGCISELDQSINPVVALVGAHIGVRDLKNLPSGAKELHRIFLIARIDISPDLSLKPKDFPALPFVLAIGANPRQ